MDNINFKYICKALTNLSGIPSRIYYKDSLQFQYSIVNLSRDPMVLYRKEIWGIKSHVGYYITPTFYLYGILNAGDIKIVIGPTAQIMPSDQDLRELAFQIVVPKEETQNFVDGMKSIIQMPLESLLMILCPINYILNGEELELKDIAIREDEQNAIKKRIESRRTEKVYDLEPKQALHNTIHLEETLMDIVRRGDIASLQEWVNNAPSIRGGKLANNQLRQLKNTFIVTATLVSRAAIKGGMDIDDAFSLSDAYIQRVEVLNTQENIINLQFNMILEFTEQVANIRRGKNPSKLATEVAIYVQHHLSETISTEDMAKEFYLSRTYFSTKFKRETGTTLTDFILSEKTEEAKRLLRYSNKSIAAIGAYLGFSSTSHFARVFKKYSTLSPGEYRERYMR